MRVLHQLGHQFTWNIDCLNKDKVGDGYIIGPNFVPATKVETLCKANPYIKVFDPQIFVSSYATKKLVSYPYHPSVVQGQYPSSPEPQRLVITASECIDLQINLDAEILVIPTESSPYHEQTVFDEQKRKYIDPFLNKIQGSQIRKPVFLQVVLDEFVIVTDTFRRKMLNWLTSFPEIDGVYIIFEVSPRAKQLSSVNFLLQVNEFIYQIKQTGMSVLLGYQNTEAILLSLSDPDYVTIGSFNNLRIFSTSHFRQKTKTQQRQPNARVYYSKLLNWVDYRYNSELERVLGTSIFDNSKYSPELTRVGYKWSGQTKEPYLHYFEVFTSQIKELSMYYGKVRYQKIAEDLSIAQRNYSQLEKHGVILEGDSRGSHISDWISVADSFAKNRGWT